jgi:ketosteroid isomerase-like protein
MTDLDPVLAVVNEFWDAVFDLDLERVLATYSDDVSRTGSGDDWYRHGIDGARKEWVDWIANAPAKYTAFEWLEGPYGEVGDDWAWASGVGIQDYQIRDDGEVRRQHIRVCWVFRRNDAGEWKIKMDHWSRPMAEPYSPENVVSKYQPTAKYRRGR